MAKVYQCDRCKKITSVFNFTSFTCVSAYTATRNFDLCPECYSEFVKFVQKKVEVE